MTKKDKYLVKKVVDGAEDVVVNADMFDAVLERMLTSKPKTFREVVVGPKFRKDGRVKRSKKARTA